MAFKAFPSWIIQIFHNGFTTCLTTSIYCGFLWKWKRKSTKTIKIFSNTGNSKQCFDVEYFHGFVWSRGLQTKSMTSQRYRAAHKMADMRYYGNVMTTTRWRLYVTMETLWHNKMAVMRYYGSVFYIFNSTVIDWTLICFFMFSFGWFPSVWNLYANVNSSKPTLVQNFQE